MDENSKTATVAECGEPLLSPKACLKCVHCNREAQKLAASMLADPAFRKKLASVIVQEALLRLVSDCQEGGKEANS